MSDDEALQRRLRAVERSLTDSDHDVDSLRTAGEQADRVDELTARLDEAEDRIAELEASTQALRGYVGNVRSVNEDVEQRADAALAAVDRLEERFDDAAPPEAGFGGPPDSPGSSGRRTESRQPPISSPDRQWKGTDAGVNDDTGGDRDCRQDRDDGNDGTGGLVARVRNAL